MARTIQSPGVEIKEIDLSLRPNLPVGTTVFIPGFANQGPTDELLTVTSLTEFEQIYGLPQNAAERYMYHTVKAVFQSPANVLVTRLPYGGDAGETFADNSSVLVYPVIPRPEMFDLGDEAMVGNNNNRRATVKENEDIVFYFDKGAGDLGALGEFELSDEASGIGCSLKDAINVALGGKLFMQSDAFPAISHDSSLDGTGDEQNTDITFVGSTQTLREIWDVFGDGEEIGFLETDGTDIYGFADTPIHTLVSENDGTGLWTARIAGEDMSVPANYIYMHPLVCQLVMKVVNNYGWDMEASDRYYIGEPSNIELTAAEYSKLVKGEVSLKTDKAGLKANQTFSTFADIENKGGIGMMIINNKKFIVNEKFEGYYVGLSDNTNLNPATDFDAVDKLKSLSKRLGGTGGGYVDVPDEFDGVSSRLTFSLSAGFTYDNFGNRKQVGLDGSISEVLENLSEYDLGTDEFSDVITMGIFKIRQSTLEPDTSKLDYILTDSVVGSFNNFREKFLSSGGEPTSMFIESEAEGSPNMILKVNDAISKGSGNWLDANGMPTKKVRVLGSLDLRTHDEITGAQALDSVISLSDGTAPSADKNVVDLRVSQKFLNDTEQGADRQFICALQRLQRIGTVNMKHGKNLYPHGVFRKQVAESKDTGSIPGKLERVFELADNYDLFPIDITVEAGLGTVFVGSHDEQGVAKDSFDEDAYYNIGSFTTAEGSGSEGQGLYTTKVIDNRSSLPYLTKYDDVFNTFKNFCQFQRKDNIFIADPLRYIFVQGKNTKVLTSANREKGVNFSQHIYWPLRHAMTGGTKNSNYCCSYANWAFTNDKSLGRGVWVPTSGFAAANMGNTDSNFYPWFAPAGFTRGLLSGITDLAFYPKQKERDQLYTIGLNPIANFPNEGFVIFGQKTMQAKPSAFDRINVRRLFLYLQKAVLNTSKYFVFEPNTLFTRTQVLNVLRPIFEEVKNTQGMYDYLIVCDERNNTPTVIDRNELIIDIYIKPTRAAEFILVNFYATRTGQDFSELIS